MNLANKLTLTRVFMVPVFIGFLILNNTFGYICSLLIFILAAITDWYDGKIARAKNMVSTLGKFADPLADKMLVSAAFISFVGIPVLHIPAWIVVIIICRDFVVNGLRLVAGSAGVVIHASGGGKIKTVLQMGTIIFILLLLCFRGYMECMPDWLKLTIEWLPLSMMLIVAGITTITGIEYVLKHKGVFNEKNNC
ncbi:MAG: CDP-diacylglycerol--glycerol-3-phosphate 3-phosphatidyltransferase [Candidatus Desantisbacteria bacterium]